MAENEREQLVKKCTTMLDGIESNLRRIWPDDKPCPGKDDDEYWTYQALVSAMVHIGDLRCDLDAVLD